MDKKLKAKWVKALLSGKYKQGRGMLCRIEDNSYCCLGVLGEVGDIPYIRISGFLDDVSDLGLTSDVQGGLADLNDCEVPFEVIAGFIDATL